MSYYTIPYLSFVVGRLEKAILKSTICNWKIMRTTVRYIKNKELLPIFLEEDSKTQPSKQLARRNYLDRVQIPTETMAKHTKGSKRLFYEMSLNFNRLAFKKADTGRTIYRKIWV